MMKKYIDVEKLKVLLSELKENNGYNGDFHNGVVFAVDEIEESIDSLLQEQLETDKYDHPITPIEEAIEVTSRMQYIDEEMKPIAKFIMDYALWNLHKDEWNQPVIEVPLFRVLDALIQRGKPYCCAS